jgi:hypothetical protein
VITYREQKAYDLRCDAEAIEATQKTVTVEISLAAAWFFRDMIGLGKYPGYGPVTLQDDMRRLNAVAGYRPVAPDGVLPEPHVSGWSARHVRGLSK